MSKKKSKQLPITEVQLTPEQIAQAKEILAGLQKDIQYAAAKKEPRSHDALRQIRGERIGHEAQ